MGKQKRVDRLLVDLAENRSFTWTEPEGGDMASMWFPNTPSVATAEKIGLRRLQEYNVYYGDLH